MSTPYPAPAFASPLTALALVVALAGSLASVWVSAALGYKACPLCFYQRSFLLAAAGVLAVGLLGGLGRSASLATLTLPMAVGGTALAGLHVYLETVQRAMECPPGLLGFPVLREFLLPELLPSGKC